MTTRRLQIPAWIVVPALGVAAWISVSRLLGDWPLDVHLRDDAYYYFCWARSLANGDGPCVTPGVATSGIHVLWALLLAAVAFVCGAAALPVSSVVLGFALHVATGVVVYRAARPLRSLGLTAAAAYVGAPFLATEAVNGQETALACFALALFLAVQHRGPRAFLWTGVFVVLARSDLICLVLAMALVEPRARAPRVLLSAFVLAIYAAVDLVLAGHWLQDSAAPIPWMIEQGLAAVAGSRMERLGEHTVAVLSGSPFRLTSTPMALAWLLAAGIGLRRRDGRFAWLLIGALGLVGMHYYWRLYPRDYYFAPLGVAAVLATLGVCRFVPRAGIVLLVLAVGWNGYRYVRYAAPTRNWQREMTMAGRFVNRFVPREASIGCFNAGIVTWYRDGAVINLDGVVNRPAFEALRRGALGSYLRDRNVHFVLDNPVQFAKSGMHANGLHFGGGFEASRDLQEIARFTWPQDATPRGREGIGFFSLYRLRERDRATVPLGAATDLGGVPGGRCVMWRGRPGVVLRSDHGVLLRSASDIFYVIQVPWSGREILRLFEGEAAEPVLIVAPK